jgi:serine/threonine protein kinase
MRGIAHALSLIHNFNVTEVTDLSLLEGFGKTRVTGDAILRVKTGEEVFGRHGDMKPENILYFRSVPGVDDEKGVMQIADFGLGRFHGRESRSKQDPQKVVASGTYEPPECKLNRPVSRAYDIWSLGCLYLEYVTWLLMGAEEIHKFSKFRGGQKQITGPHKDIDDDNFFTIYRDPETRLYEAKVRVEVIRWVKKLHEHHKCSALMHEIVNLVMDQLLVIDSGDRIHALPLLAKFNDFYERAQIDKKYMLESIPDPQDPDDGVENKDTSFNSGSPKVTPQRRVNFAEPSVTNTPT